MSTISEFITAALQLAIRNLKSGKTAQQTILEARTKWWRDYTPEIQSGVERCVTNYYNTQANKPLPVTPGEQGPKIIENPDPKLDVWVAKALDIVQNPSNYKKDEILAFSASWGPTLRPSWTKAKMVEAIGEALKTNKAA